MWVGKIVVKGVDVKDYSIGERVCSYGGIRETHIINAIGNDRLLKVPTGVSWKSAVCYDPAQFALSGIRDGNVRPGDYIAVIGLGAIGLMAVQLGKKIGARPVIGVDPIAIRREAALNSGADYVLDPGECDVGLEIKRLTGKLGADCIIETSGSAGALPAQFAFSGIRDGNVRPGDYIAVIGLGAIGLMAVQLGKKIGARPVIGVDPIAIRREAALNSGADYVLDPGECDVGLEIKRLTGKLGADCIIETSGSAGALQSALRGLAYGGTVSYVAWAREFAGGINFGREAHYNYGRVVFSRAASEPSPDFPRWDRKRIEKTCWNLILDGSLSGDDIVDPVVNFEESPSAYCKYVDTNPELSIKLGVAF